MKNKNYELPATSYIPVIGLEVHVELKTKSKMFCSCKAEYFGEKPNSNTCPVCLGLPGALPVPNKKAIEWCVMIGLALNCKIPLFSKFDRKNYFYPDLAKGYQISQYDQPFAVNGHIVIARRDPSLRSGQTPQSQSKEIAARTTFARNDSNNKIIRIRRVHMEEDTAKLVHQSKVQSSKFKVQSYEGYTLIDFNRSGVPLVEIVTEPDFESAIEVVEYLKKIQQIVRYLEVSDADMEKGEMRLEPNISLARSSLRVAGSQNHEPPATRHLPPYKVEVKNINSFRFVEKAINYETERQKKLLREGKTPIQETRGWDDKKQITVSQRVKEEAMDYRYFPEPDVPPVRWREYEISPAKQDLASLENLKSQISELPDQKSNRFRKEYGLSTYDSEILTRERSIADYFEEAIRASREVSSIKYQVLSKNIANYIINKKVDINKTLPAELVKIIIGNTQKSLLDANKLREAIIQVLSQNQKAVEDYKKGKTAVIGFLIGQVKQAIKQPLDTEQVKRAIEKQINTD